MRSIKPGRGQSIASIVGGVFFVLVGTAWTIGTASMLWPDSHAPWFFKFVFPLMGILFVFIGLGTIVTGIYNIVSNKRQSAFDITSDREESDPLNDFFGQSSSQHKDVTDSQHDISPVRPKHDASQLSIRQRLANLDDLKSQGQISEQEYADQRERILDQI